MFMITYSELINTKWENKSKTFPTLEKAEEALNKSIMRDDFKHHRIWVPQGTENIDYKDKFEELYDYVLKNAGIRESDVSNKKKVII